MAQSIINNTSYTVAVNGQTADPVAVAAGAVTVLEEDDFSMTKVPDFTVWADTSQPLPYVITFTNESGVEIDSVIVNDTMPVATATTAGLTLLAGTVTATLVPPGTAVIDTSGSTATDLIVSVTGGIDIGAVLTIEFNTNYVAPTGP